MNQEVKHSGIWWTDRDEIPTRRMLPYNSANATGEADLTAPETVGVLQKLKGGEKGVSLKLPPIPMKLFGRKRDHKTTKGWGRLDAEHKFQHIDISSYLDHRGRGAENFSGTDNISRAYSLRLLKKGYDRRRAAKAGIVDIDWGEEDEESIVPQEESPKKLESDEEPDDTFGEEDEKRAKKAKREEAKTAGILD